MDPKAFIDIAQNLIDESTPSEAAIRTSIGRSYFGLYNLLGGFIERHGFDLPKAAKAHEVVRRDLAGCGIEAARQIASFLDDLREDRNQADYQLELSKYADVRLATYALKKARKAYHDFEMLIDSKKKRQQLKKHITKYRQSINS